MPRPNPFPISSWPTQYRAIGAAFDSSRRSACSKYLRWCLSVGLMPCELDEERAAIWLNSVGPKDSRKSTRPVAALAVFFMLSQVHPERDFTWLKAVASRESTRRKEGATYAHRKCEESLPVDEWPPEWIRRWRSATGSVLNPGDFKSKSRWGDLRREGAREWRKSYAERVQNDLGAYLWVMKEAGMPVDITCQSLQMFICAKRELGVKEKWIPSYVKRLAAGFRVVLPNGSPRFVSATATGMKARYRSAGHDEADDMRPEHPAVLAAIGLRLIERSRRLPFGSAKCVALFRDGALFYTLAFRAMRPGTVVRMKHGEHLNLRKEKGRICAPSSIMKARRAWRVDLNADIVSILREWIEVHRPFMKNASSPFVFVSSQPSRTGGMTTQAIGRIIRKHSMAYLGRRLSTRHFRYATGTLVMDEIPENPWVGTAMLQHHSSRTLVVYTPGADSAAAAEKFGAIADEVQKSAAAAVRG